ncbi:hypothetical protein DL93DRAFT_2085526 [Clavulina sp. PMI_390]|nr:hypothetical protein DL93DRAFT_2085526 [Clavulina sp. PMI_390]
MPLHNLLQQDTPNSRSFIIQLAVSSHAPGGPQPHAFCNENVPPSTPARLDSTRSESSNSAQTSRPRDTTNSDYDRQILPKSPSRTSISDVSSPGPDWNVLSRLGYTECDLSRLLLSEVTTLLDRIWNVRIPFLNTVTT